MKRQGLNFEGIIIQDDVWVGANSTILDGITIERGSIIGAGAVVTKNVKDHALMVGNPARQIGRVCQCGERLPEDLECISCQQKYVEKGDGIEIKKS